MDNSNIAWVLANSGNFSGRLVVVSTRFCLPVPFDPSGV